MRSWPRQLALLLATGGCAHGSLGPRPGGPDEDRASLRRAIDSMLAAPEIRQARVGVLIVDPERGDTLYSRDAGKLFVPASNMKIVTAAVALDALGPDYRFPTRFHATGVTRDGVLEGDLLVVGLGDPSVSDNVAGDAMLPLRAIADSLWEQGVRRIRGRVRPFGNAFPDANAGFGWSWEDLEFSYGAVVDELLFNEGYSEIRVRGGERPGDPPTVRTLPARTFPAVRVTATTVPRGIGRDSLPQLDAVKDTLRGDVVVSGTIPPGDSATLEVTHRDPAAAYIEAFREALRDRGISVDDSTQLSNVPVLANIPLLVAYESPPLAQILPAFMKPSQNQIGEMLFKAVALQRTDSGAARFARRFTAERLRGWGAPADGFLIYDGSGLSRRNYVSPETIVRVLDAMRRGPHFQVYLDALPVAGVDGTLRGRMRGTTGEANVRGKTGTLGNVRSLSGYVTTTGGRHLIFSVLVNNYLVSTDYVSRVQDSIAVRLTRLRGGRGEGGGN